MICEEISERHDQAVSSQGSIQGPGAKAVTEVRISGVGTDFKRLEALLLAENLPIVSVPEHMFQ